MKIQKVVVGDVVAHIWDLSHLLEYIMTNPFLLTKIEDKDNLEVKLGLPSIPLRNLRIDSHRFPFGLIYEYADLEGNAFFPCRLF